MIKLSAQTKLSAEDAIKRAVSFFGAGGVGLDLKEQQGNCAHFEGGGGVVDVTACAEEKGCSLEIASQEWDEQAKEFVSRLPR